MRQTSTKKWVPLKKCLVLFFTILGIFTSGSLFAHTVNYYTASCNSGPVYSILPNVSNVNSGSNYAWQYKNASGTWVCILNGNNTINGQTYSVSGATSTATTNPAALVFNNPNSGLQGLVVRCVISDGSGVNPCNVPVNNTWNSTSSSVNHTINVTNTPCATSLLTLGNRVWYDTNNNGINDASENGIANVTVNLYKDDNNDNVADGAAIATTVTNSTGYYSFTGLSAGNYIVGAVTPNGYMSSSVNGGDPDNNTDLDDNGQVVAGNEMRGLAITLASGTEPTSGNTNNTYDFGFLPDCTCTTSAGNLLVNGSFENGTTGWSWSGGTLTTGTGYIACGAANGFNNWSSGTAKVWQDVAVTAGQIVTFKAFAGTHTAGISCSPKLSLIFLNAANTVLGQTDVVVTRDVDVNSSQLEQYSITAISPTGTTKVRVQSAITCNTMKIDAFCLTTTPALFNLSGNVWHDVNGMNDNLVNNTGPLQTPPAQAIPTGLRISRVDASTGVVLAVALVQGNGTFFFPNVSPGNYILVLSPVPGAVGFQAPFASLPAGWINTGEHLGITPGMDAVVNGKLSVSLVNADVINCNFGIQLSNDDIGIN